MIGIFLIYFIGRAFYDLAFEFNKSQWGYAILGVVSYYAGTIIGEVVLLLGAALLFDIDIFTEPPMGISFMAVPFGLLACWGLHRILKYNWKKKTEAPESESVLDGNFNSVENQ